MKQASRRLLGEENGATSIEYGLIAGLIACGLILSLGTVGNRLGTVLTALAAGLGDGTAPAAAPAAMTSNHVGG